MTRPPPYLAALLALSDTLDRGAVLLVEVRHDPGCPKLTGAGPCACSPDVEIRPVPEPEDAHV